MIPITRPFIFDDEANAAAEVVRSGWLAQGRHVTEFEDRFAECAGAKHAVATSSCTTALHMALSVSGIGSGDEVIVPSFSFIASANAVIYCGARPVFVDIDPRTYNIDPALIESAITDRTKAILPVHQVGLPADLDAIQSIAARHGLAVIDDAACALGARYKGRPVGSSDTLSCFSFHPRKLITTGEGGMITTNNDSRAELLRKIRNHGMSVSALSRHEAKKVVFEEYELLGYNYRMTDIQAAIGVVQLSRLFTILTRRREIAQKYSEAFKDIACLEIPFEPDSYTHAFQSYVLRVLPQGRCDRDCMMDELLHHEISTRRGVMAIHREPFYRRELDQLHLPETDRAADETLCLPLYPQMTEQEQDRVIAGVSELC